MPNSRAGWLQRLRARTGFFEERWQKDETEEIRPARTLWDWLQLVAVPVALAVLALLFNSWQSDRDARREEARASREREIAREARLDAILQTYTSQLSDLILDHKLLTSRREADVRTAARTLTLAAVRRLDGKRKGEVVQYLVDARLVIGSSQGYVRGGGPLTRPPKVSLAGADLRNADLREAAIFGVDFSGADLRKARFDNAHITLSDLSYALLEDASFRGSQLADSRFEHARLNRANFDRAHFVIPDPSDPLPTDMPNACLTDARFRKADLTGADLEAAIGLRVDLTGATGSVKVLEGAEFKQTNVRDLDLNGHLSKNWTATGVKFGSVSEIRRDCARAGRRYPATLP